MYSFSTHGVEADHPQNLSDRSSSTYPHKNFNLSITLLGNTPHEQTYIQTYQPTKQSRNRTFLVEVKRCKFKLSNNDIKDTTKCTNRLTLQ